MSGLHHVLLLLSLVLCTCGMPARGEYKESGGGAMNCGLQVDAGSTGSRLFVYTWAARESSCDEDVRTGAAGSRLSVPEPSQCDNKKTTRIPLASFANNPAGVGENLAPLFEYAKESIAKADCGGIANVPVFFGATAGMRVIAPNASEAIMGAVRTFIRSTGFRFDSDSWARVISGTEEGAFGWLAVNWLADTYGRSNGNATVGLLDLGGASTQITFAPKEDILSDYFQVQLNHKTETDLFSHSFLYFGRDEALKRQSAAVAAAGNTSNPCFPVGSYDQQQANLTGSGDPAACRDSMKALFPRSEECFHADGSRCTLLGAYMPQIPADLHFVGIGGLVYIWDSMNFTSGEGSIGDLIAKSEEVCSMNFQNLISYNNKLLAPEPNTTTMNLVAEICFAVTYTTTLLSEYGFPLEKSPITAVNDIGGTDASWALGSIIYNANKLEWTQDQKGTVKTSTFVILSVALTLVTVGFLAVSAYACKLSKRVRGADGYDNLRQ